MSSSNRSAEEAFEFPAEVVDEEHCPKRLRSSDPDVCVVVGGEKFYYYGSILSYSSEYFDAALTSFFQEGTTRTFNFPDKSAEEWKLVYRFLEPTTGAAVPEITEDNLSVFVPWFSLLGMAEWINRCDRIIKKVMISKHASINQHDASNNYIASSSIGQSLVADVINMLELCTQYDLKASIAEGISALKSGTKCAKLWNESNINGLISVMKNHTTTRESLMPFIKESLPDSVPDDMDSEALLQNPLLPALLSLSVKHPPVRTVRDQDEGILSEEDFSVEILSSDDEPVVPRRMRRMRHRP